jgi:hypothetical protein
MPAIRITRVRGTCQPGDGAQAIDFGPVGGLLEARPRRFR